MAFKTSLCFLMAIIFFFVVTSISSSHPYTFQVGGKDGWTLHPSESYNNWGGRLRFLINDTLHFKYDGSSDSVLVVNRSTYDGCNGNNPVLKLEGGDSTFKFDRSGPFYFITGKKSNCDQGQKLIVVVLAVRNRSRTSSAATPPTALPPSPEISPVFPQSPLSPPAETPVSTPPAPSPGGGAPSPWGGEGGAPTPRTTGGGGAPTPSEGGAPSPGGGGAPTPGTTGGGGDRAPTPATGTGGGAPSPGSGGGNNPSADTTSPTPPSAATPPLSGGLTALGVTVIFALWGI